jgi:hypothetical protein
MVSTDAHVICEYNCISVYIYITDFLHNPMNFMYYNFKTSSLRRVCAKFLSKDHILGDFSKQNANFIMYTLFEKFGAFPSTKQGQKGQNVIGSI